jgi:hypothetical protein
MIVAQIQFGIDVGHMVYLAIGLIVTLLGVWIKSMVTGSQAVASADLLRQQEQVTKPLVDKLDALRDMLSTLTTQVRLDSQQSLLNHQAVTGDISRICSDVKSNEQYAHKMNHDLRGIIAGFEGRLSSLEHERHRRGD